MAAVADPNEGVATDGTIRTGADRVRVPDAFEPVLADAVACLGQGQASLYVYGSVANGTAHLGKSDVDLLSIDLADATILGHRLSARYTDRCRGVEIAPATSADFAGDSDAAYGFRVFLRHYCVHLAGPDPSAALPAFPADARAARSFNGDLGQHLQQWRQGLKSQPLAADLLGVRVARKTLLAVAGLVSVHDDTWTTDRSRAVLRWSELEPGLAAQLGGLHSWATSGSCPSREEVGQALAHDGIVSVIVQRFGRLIGLWTDHPDVL